MPEYKSEVKMLAKAIYEIRLLLAHYLGSEVEGDIAVREAAHLAYALHNEAEAILNGSDFDVEEAQKKIKIIDDMLGGDLSSRLDKL